jgi:predicted XRE-type DNA-binding protein
MAKGTQPKISRNKRIVEYRTVKNMKFEAIAKVFNISRQRASELYNREVNRLEQAEKEGV